MLLSYMRGKHWSIIWTIARIYLGVQWLLAGWNKIGGKFDSTGFIKQATENAQGMMEVQKWYAFFLEHVVIPHITLFNVVIPWVEFLIGLALILGIFSTVSLYISAFMNLNFMLAGASNPNPLLFTIAIILLIMGASSYRYGLDYYVLPKLKEVFTKDIQSNV